MEDFVLNKSYIRGDKRLFKTHPLQWLNVICNVRIVGDVAPSTASPLLVLPCDVCADTRQQRAAIGSTTPRLHLHAEAEQYRRKQPRFFFSSVNHLHERTCIFLRQTAVTRPSADAPPPAPNCARRLVKRSRVAATSEITDRLGAMHVVPPSTGAVRT